MAVATDQPPPPSQINPDLPPELSDLVMQLLEKDPDRRPASAGEVVAGPASPGEETGPAAGGRGRRRCRWPPRREACRRPRSGAGCRCCVAALVLLAGLVGVGLWASGLIRIQTDQGDYVIDTDDPDFSFQVSKGDASRWRTARPTASTT